MNCTVISSPGTRQYSNKPICPPGQSNKHQESGGGGGGKFFLTLGETNQIIPFAVYSYFNNVSGALTLAGGATLVYAKYDPDFRKTLTTYVPFTEPILTTMDDLSPAKLYDNAKNSLMSTFGGDGQKSLGDKPSIPPPKEYKGIYEKFKCYTEGCYEYVCHHCLIVNSQSI